MIITYCRSTRLHIGKGTQPETGIIFFSDLVDAIEKEFASRHRAAFDKVDREILRRRLSGSTVLRYAVFSLTWKTVQIRFILHLTQPLLALSLVAYHKARFWAPFRSRCGPEHCSV